MKLETSMSKPEPAEDQSLSLREIFTQMNVELARLQASLARAEVDRLKEQLAWERARRRRGLFGLGR